jgi:predicted RNA-binding protein with PUA-like domain
MRYWLMKSEPDEVSIDDVRNAPSRTVPWFGVRNYQAEDMCPLEKWTVDRHP